MSGSMQDVIISDAIIKEADGVDLNLAYEAVRKDAFVDSKDKNKLEPIDITDIGKPRQVRWHKDNVRCMD